MNIRSPIPDIPRYRAFSGTLTVFCAVLFFSWAFTAYCASSSLRGPSLTEIRRALSRLSSDPTCSRHDWDRVIQSLLSIHGTANGPEAQEALFLAGKASLGLYRRGGTAEDLDRAISYLSDFVRANHKSLNLIAGLKDLKAACLLKRRLATASTNKPSVVPRGPISAAQPEASAGRRQTGRPLGPGTPNEESPAVRSNTAGTQSRAASLPGFFNKCGNPFFSAPAGATGAASAPIENPLPRYPPITSPSAAPPATTSASIAPPEVSDCVSPHQDTNAAPGKYVVVIDPGHGGKDPGAVSTDGKIREKDVTLDISKRLRAHLMEKFPEATVEMTRYEDKFLSLQERTAIANSMDADLFVSIHCNSAGDTVSKGVETFYLSKAGSKGAMRVAARENGIPLSKMSDLEATLVDLMVTAKKTESDRLANAVQTSLVQRLKQSHRSRDRGVKGAPFYVLLGAKMPAVLVECAFITSRYDKEGLTSASHLDAISQGIADGAKCYLDGLGDTESAATVQR